MKRMITAALAAAVMFAAGPVQAHHAASSLGSVRVTQPVLAGGTTLQPGTYEIRLTGEHMKPLPGQSEDAVQQVEFIANGTVAAKYAAEVMTGEDVPVGTGGVTSGGTSRGRFDLLQGGDFARVSISRGGEKFLIHLPVAK
jgi:hypothetical protein